MGDPDSLMLSQKDAAELSAMLKWFKKHVHGDKSRSPLPDLPQAPEVYIARVPAGGIAAYGTPAGTDSGSDIADAHYALCKLYWIRHTTDTDVDTMPLGVSENVWNLSTTAIAENTIVLAVRDKAGKFIATSVGGPAAPVAGSMTYIGHLDDTGSLSAGITFSNLDAGTYIIQCQCTGFESYGTAGTPLQVRLGTLIAQSGGADLGSIPTTNYSTSYVLTATGGGGIGTAAQLFHSQTNVFKVTTNPNAVLYTGVLTVQTTPFGATTGVTVTGDLWKLS